MDGIINLNKPPGISSAQALYRVRAITGQRKSGHAGTLDPLATGVLVLCLGKATRLVEEIMELSKVYRATARLDVTSESQDAGRPLVPISVAAVPTEWKVRETMSGFVGTILQEPPVISAIKIQGRPAYKRAIEGEKVVLQPRLVRIDWIRLLHYDWPELAFELCCGRGTYVRALIRDLGAQLNTGGCLTSLQRVRVGPFTLASAWSLESLQGADATEYLIPPHRSCKLFLETGPSSRQPATSRL